MMELADMIMRQHYSIYVDNTHYSSHMYLTLTSISGKQYIVNKDLRANSLNKLASVDLWKVCVVLLLPCACAKQGEGSKWHLCRVSWQQRIPPFLVGFQLDICS